MRPARSPETSELPTSGRLWNGLHGNKSRLVEGVARLDPRVPNDVRNRYRRAVSAVLKQRAEGRVLPTEALTLQQEGFFETWLFERDGRFALRTLALEQEPAD